jgi:hypothetical protein
MHFRMQPFAQRVIEFRHQLDCPVTGSIGVAVLFQRQQRQPATEPRFRQIWLQRDCTVVAGKRFVRFQDLRKWLCRSRMMEDRKSPKFDDTTPRLFQASDERPRSLAPGAAKWRDQIFYYLTIVTSCSVVQPAAGETAQRCTERRPVIGVPSWCPFTHRPLGADRLRVGQARGRAKHQA